jgi:hypothetical protein
MGVDQANAPNPRQSAQPPQAFKHGRLETCGGKPVFQRFNINSEICRYEPPNQLLAAVATPI